MNEEEIRNMIKIQLQHLNKEQLIDVLIIPAFRMSNVLSSLQCTNIRYDIDRVQQVNMNFDPLQSILKKEENHG